MNSSLNRSPKYRMKQHTAGVVIQKIRQNSFQTACTLASGQHLEGLDLYDLNRQNHQQVGFLAIYSTSTAPPTSLSQCVIYEHIQDKVCAIFGQSSEMYLPDPRQYQIIERSTLPLRARGALQQLHLLNPLHSDATLAWVPQLRRPGQARRPRCASFPCGPAQSGPCRSARSGAAPPHRLGAPRARPWFISQRIGQVLLPRHRCQERQIGRSRALITVHLETAS